MISIPQKTLIYKEIFRFMRLWKQTLFPTIITAILYMTIFGKILGARIGAMSGVNYIHYVIPGLATLSMMLSAFQNTASSFYGEKFSRSIEEIIMAPLTNIEVVVGFLSGGIIRGSIAGTLILIVGSIFTHLSVMHPLYLLLVMMMATTFFASLGMLNGMLARTFDHITILPDFILTPLIFLGGVFYETKDLPGLMQIIHIYNPIVYFVDSVRYAVIGVGEFSVLHQCVVLFLLNAAIFSLLLFCYNRGYGYKE